MNNHNRFQQELDIFAHNLVWLRTHCGISKKEMAALLGIGLGSLNRLEKGELPPRVSVNIFFAIQKQFGISPSDQLSRPLEESNHCT